MEISTSMQHTIPFRQQLPSMQSDLLAQDWMNEWKTVPALSIDQVRKESHRVCPQVQLKLLHDGKHLSVMFAVVESGVISRETAFNGQVWRDSCVELFLQPPNAQGYFNFEFNAGGCIHASFVTDWQRNVDGDVSQRRLLAVNELQQVTIFSSLPTLIDKPLMDRVNWYLAASIPLSLMQDDVPDAVFSNAGWRGNFYKCSEDGPFPHWLSWAPLTHLNFHAPDEFGQLVFL